MGLETVGEIKNILFTPPATIEIALNWGGTKSRSTKWRPDRNLVRSVSCEPMHVHGTPGGRLNLVFQQLCEEIQLRMPGDEPFIRRDEIVE